MKIEYTNFKREFMAVRKGYCVFDKWFCVERFWSGKLITISIKHHQITIDLRGKDWINDLADIGKYHK